MADDQEERVHIMLPEMVPHWRRGPRTRKLYPRRAKRQEMEGPYGHGLGDQPPPVIYVPPPGRRNPTHTMPSGSNSKAVIRASRDSDAELLARLAKSKAESKKEPPVPKLQQKRKAEPASKGGKTAKRYSLPWMLHSC